MKVFQINICPDLSTGRIMMGIANQVRISKGSCVTASALKDVKVDADHYYIGTKLDRHMHILFGKLIGCEFAFSYFATKKLITQIKNYDPDVIHLHNLHAYYLNMRVLMNYLKTCEKKLFWTFHDCWPFTGHCPHFVGVGCEKWKTCCGDCPQYRVYPGGIVDRTAAKFQKKKEWFAGLPKLTIVTPSNWLADLVKQSFFSKCNIQVIHNGINLSTYHPEPSNVREKYDCQDKKLLLGVASHWSERKGLDVFVHLAKELGDQYRIILVGTDETIDAQLPKNIISVHRTSDQKELAQLYSAADLFVNPTREDNYPTVNMEALACGTPVLTFDTGGSSEIPDKTCGAVVPCGDVKAMKQQIIRICNDKPYSQEDCLKRASYFNQQERYIDYLELYRNDM